MRPAGIGPHLLLQLLNHLREGAPPALADRPLLLNDLGTNRLLHMKKMLFSLLSLTRTCSHLVRPVEFADIFLLKAGSPALLDQLLLLKALGTNRLLRNRNAFQVDKTPKLAMLYAWLSLQTFLLQLCDHSHIAVPVQVVRYLRMCFERTARYRFSNLMRGILMDLY
jgi:hypothetical protein